MRTEEDPMSHNMIFLLIFIFFVLVTIAKLVILKLYMDTIKPEVDAEGNIISKPVKDKLSEEEREEREFDRDW